MDLQLHFEYSEDKNDCTITMQFVDIRWGESANISFQLSPRHLVN